MDFWSRLLGGAAPAKKAPAAKPVNDSATRLQRFKKVWSTVKQICDKPRGKDPVSEQNDLDQLRIALDRVGQLLRDETRAPVPHLCLQYASSNQIYTTISRAAALSHYEPVIAAAVAVYSALIDSEEEDFLTSNSFAKSLMRMVKSVIDNGSLLIGIDTETAVLEVLFTITAKIRLQPEILPFWFASTAKNESEDIFAKEKKTFVGITQKEDFPLCYLLIDRVHHEGRIGDFARTGLLYIFEATGRSNDLEEWVVSSDLPTLMASGLGALYSQLGRELSILHPDATLPAVLAMSDYSTQHPHSSATSVFSAQHMAHMSTFLSYLAFWQDVLDHCRSADVKQTLLDHFQILFLQQLLYPSILQSSDTDAGSSVAVLTYMAAVLEHLEHPELLHMVLRYLLAIPSDSQIRNGSLQEKDNENLTSGPQSPKAVKRRQSLMFMAAPKNPDDIVAPELFSLTDLILNSASSNSDQTVFAALRLTSVLLGRQRKYSLGTFVKMEQSGHRVPTTRTVGALEEEVQQYSSFLEELGPVTGLDGAYTNMCHDIRSAVESQVPFRSPVDSSALNDASLTSEAHANQYTLQQGDPLMKSLDALLRTFWSNSVDINLALTQAIISMAICLELSLEPWLAADSSSYRYSTEEDDLEAIRSRQRRPWQASLTGDETAAFAKLQKATRRPQWAEGALSTPLIWRTIHDLVSELNMVRETIQNLDQLAAGRKNMLQANGLPDAPLTPAGVDNAHAMPGSRGMSPSPYLSVPSRKQLPQQAPTSRSSPASKGHSRSSSASSLDRGRTKATGATANLDISLRASDHGATSPAVQSSKLSGAIGAGVRPSDTASETIAVGSPRLLSPAASRPGLRNIFLPPPPETPSTTDVLMRVIEFPGVGAATLAKHPGQEPDEDANVESNGKRTASLNHVLTNIVVLQDFVMELVAVLQVRASVLGEREVIVT